MLLHPHVFLVGVSGAFFDLQSIAGSWDRESLWRLHKNKEAEFKVTQLSVMNAAANCHGPQRMVSVGYDAQFLVWTVVFSG